MSGFSIDNISSQMNNSIQSQESDLESMVADADVTNMADMLKLQMKTSKYELTIKIASSLANNLKNTISQIANK